MAAAVPWILGALSAVQAVGSIQQGQAQSAALKTQVAGASYNAEVSRQQAEAALQVSSAQQMQLRREQRQQFGRMRAASAQAGVGEGGSTADIFEQSQTLAELDVLNIAYDGMLRARGFSTQADLDEFGARAFQKQAKSARRAGYFGAAGSLLSGGYALRGSFGGSTPRTTVGMGGGTGLRAPSTVRYGGNLRFGS